MHLYNHQKDAIEFAVKNNGLVALYHDPGLGKTRTTLEIFRYFKERNPNLKMFVSCPKNLIEEAWGKDSRKFTNFKFTSYMSLKDMNDIRNSDIVAINFESEIQEERLKKIKEILSYGDWMSVVDESSKMKSHKSITTKSLMSIARYSKHRVVASGTPAPNGYQEFWGQAKFVDNSCFPDSFFKFRNTYFHLERNGQIMAQRGAFMTKNMMRDILSQGWKYAITEQNKRLLLQKMAHFTHWAKKKDCLDLPPKTPIVLPVYLNPNEKKMYKDMAKHLVADIKTKKGMVSLAANTALSKLMKLRQATAGFLYDDDLKAWRPGKSSKMRELEDRIEQLGDRQVKIWVEFTEEVTAISELLTKMNKTFVTLYGGTEDKPDSINKFINGEAQYLVANPASAAHGLTFINSYIDIYFSLSHSWEKHSQSYQRDERIGQTHPMLAYYLMAVGTIDYDIKDVLDGKKTLEDVYHKIMKEYQ